MTSAHITVNVVGSRQTEDPGPSRSRIGSKEEKSSEILLTKRGLMEKLDVTALELRRNYEHLPKELEPVIKMHQDVEGILQTLVQTSTFVAGVQASILPLTMGSNESSYRVAINWFGFCGFILDISGGIFGAYRLMYNHMVATELERFLGQIKEHQALFDEFADGLRKDRSSMSNEDIQTANEAIKGFSESFCKLVGQLKQDGLLKFVLRGNKVTLEPRKETKLNCDTIMTTIRGGKLRSHIGVMLSKEVVVVSMVLGMIFLLISVMMEVQVTQWKRVWSACIFFASFTAFYALAPLLVAE
ncbi:hypothetical protein ONZ45_g3466 [Pleurotus djamor]|nr:hypothetical protein ONZ45_g3466 [Pleurotus djamor]